MVAAVLVGMIAWEWRMRTLQLLPGDVRDNPSAWAEQRRRVDSEDIQIAMVGDSRVLFGTDLARFKALTGIEPLQLALAGTNARPFLEELSEDPHFRGLAIVGIAEGSFFRKEPGLFADALGRYRFESPAQRSSFLIYRTLSKVLGFMDRDYRLSALLQRLDRGVRAGARSPYMEPWKFSTMGDHRQFGLWSRIETDAYLNGHARALWMRNVRKARPLSEEVIQMTLTASRTAVAAIRARGGDVIFLRPPSRGEYRVNERRIAPREKVWDALLAFAEVKGLHSEDDPIASQLFLPEFSHLTRSCATVYTDSFVRRLAQLTPRVKLRADAPPPLSPADCAPTPQAMRVQTLLEQGKQ